jgi:molecular chaperone DnaJ
MSKDYYKVLGVQKNASPDEIKKAFRKLAHEHHPDKGGNEAKFKELNEAYQVLGDQQKRSQYDQFGSAFEHGQAGGGFSGFGDFRDFSGFSQGFDINLDDFGDMFGNFGEAFGFGGGQSRGRKRERAERGDDIEVILNIEFSEAVFGTEKEISLKKAVRCDKCQGNGVEPGSKIEECKTCGGSGRTRKVQRTILGNVQIQMTCSDCGGEGRAHTQKCSKCSGTGAISEIVKLKIKIPAGVDTGNTIRIQSQGEAGKRGGAGGDLYLKIKVNHDKRFSRNGFNILSKVYINFTQAALGDKIEIETVDGLEKLKIPEGCQSGTVFTLKEKGVPHLEAKRTFSGGYSKRGDQLVEVIVKTPTNLNKKQKQLLEDLRS